MWVEPLAWSPTLAEALAAAEAVATSWGWPMSPVGGAPEGTACLRSGLRVEGLGRWSLLTCAPSAPRALGEAPFEALRDLLDGFPAGEGPGPGFGGGAIGVIGYGALTAVEPAVEGLPPDPQGDGWMGLYDTWLTWDDQRAWLASWGLERPDAAPSASLATEKLARWRRALEASRGLPAAPQAPWPRFTPDLDRDTWERAFWAVKDAIAAGEIYQGCLTFPLTAPREHHTARALFEALDRAHPAPMASLLVPPGDRALASASPERLLRVAHGRATARPMKGTRPRGHTQALDDDLAAQLLASPKDRAENVMIVDLMRNDLGRVCALGSVEVPDLFTLERYASVHQLTSTITGLLAPGRSALDAARACFPPGSMTGAPKVAAMRLLAYLEPDPRTWYAGAVGWFDGRGDADLAVTIRAAIVEPERLRWHVGGGIVADSDPALEWAEALQKCPLRATGAP